MMMSSAKRVAGGERSAAPGHAVPGAPARPAGRRRAAGARPGARRAAGRQPGQNPPRPPPRASAQGREGAGAEPGDQAALRRGRPRRDEVAFPGARGRWQTVPWQEATLEHVRLMAAYREQEAAAMAELPLLGWPPPPPRHASSPPPWKPTRCQPPLRDLRRCPVGRQRQDDRGPARPPGGAPGADRSSPGPSSAATPASASAANTGAWDVRAAARRVRPGARDAKCCARCGQVKPLGEFHRRSQSPDGREHRCLITA